MANQPDNVNFWSWFNGIWRIAHSVLLPTSSPKTVLSAAWSLIAAITLSARNPWWSSLDNFSSHASQFALSFCAAWSHLLAGSLTFCANTASKNSLASAKIAMSASRCLPKSSGLLLTWITLTLSGQKRANGKLVPTNKIKSAFWATSKAGLVPKRPIEPIKLGWSDGIIPVPGTAVTTGVWKSSENWITCWRAPATPRPIQSTGCLAAFNAAMVSLIAESSIAEWTGCW